MRKLNTGFASKYQNLNKEEKKRFREKICKALSINNRNTFGLYKNGLREAKGSKQTALWKILKEFKIEIPETVS